jgi:hypothetical protein
LHPNSGAAAIGGICRPIDQIEPVLTFVKAYLEAHGRATTAQIVDARPPLDIVDAVGSHASGRGIDTTASSAGSGGHEQVVPVAHDCVVQKRGGQAFVEACG